MGVLHVALNDGCVVLDCLLVVVDHLVRLCPLVHVPNVFWVPLHAPTEREHRLLKLLHAAVGKPNVVVNVGLKAQKRFVLQRSFQCLDALLVLLVCVVGQAKFVKHLGVALVLA